MLATLLVCWLVWWFHQNFRSLICASAGRTQQQIPKPRQCSTLAIISMRKYSPLLAILLVVIFSACNKTKIIEGDLFYSIFRYGSFYDQPDSVIRQVKNWADSVQKKNLDSLGIEFLTKYEILKNENILYYPYIEILLDNGSVSRLYFTKEDYSPIKEFNYKDLITTSTKVRIKVLVKDLGYSMNLCKKVYWIKKVEGETFNKEKKFSITDYR
jgi:hypothetical protein